MNDLDALMFFWTHHMIVGTTEELDEEMMGWIMEAYDFAATKR